MNRTTPALACAAPTTSRPHGPSSMRDLGGVLAQRVGQLRGDLAPQPRGLRRCVRRDGEPAVGVTTHTALGTPLSVSSTWTWPASGIGISTEPRSSRPSAAAAGSSKSSMSNGPSSSSSSVRRSVPRRRRRKRRRRVWRVFRMPSQTRMSAGGTVAAVATGSVGQAGLVERRHLDQFGQFDPLHQQLGDPVAAMHDDRRAAGSRLISATLISPR